MLVLYAGGSYVTDDFQICDELNTPTLPNIQKWAGHRGSWKCVVSESAGRMYMVSESVNCLEAILFHVHILVPVEQIRRVFGDNLGKIFLISP